MASAGHRARPALVAGTRDDRRARLTSAGCSPWGRRPPAAPGDRDPEHATRAAGPGPGSGRRDHPRAGCGYFAADADSRANGRCRHPDAAEAVRRELDRMSVPVTRIQRMATQFHGWPEQAYDVLLELDGDPARETRERVRRERETLVRK